VAAYTLATRDFKTTLSTSKINIQSDISSERHGALLKEFLSEYKYISSNRSVPTFIIGRLDFTGEPAAFTRGRIDRSYRFSADVAAIFKPTSGFSIVIRQRLRGSIGDEPDEDISRKYVYTGKIEEGLDRANRKGAPVAHITYGKNQFERIAVGDFSTDFDRDTSGNITRHPPVITTEENLPYVPLGSSVESIKARIFTHKDGPKLFILGQPFRNERLAYTEQQSRLFIAFSFAEETKIGDSASEKDTSGYNWLDLGFDSLSGNTHYVNVT
jgi:hypothetical protein